MSRTPSYLARIGVVLAILALGLHSAARAGETSDTSDEVVDLLYLGLRGEPEALVELEQQADGELWTVLALYVGLPPEDCVVEMGWQAESGP